MECKSENKKRNSTHMTPDEEKAKKLRRNTYKKVTTFTKY